MCEYQVPTGTTLITINPNMDLKQCDSWDYKDLQAFAKRVGLSASGKKTALIARIRRWHSLSFPKDKMEAVSNTFALQDHSGVSDSLLSPLKVRTKKHDDGTPVGILTPASTLRYQSILKQALQRAADASKLPVGTPMGPPRSMAPPTPATPATPATPLGDLVPAGADRASIAPDTPKTAQKKKRLSFSLLNGVKIIPPRAGAPPSPPESFVFYTRYGYLPPDENSPNCSPEKENTYPAKAPQAEQEPSDEPSEPLEASDSRLPHPSHPSPQEIQELEDQMAQDALRAEQELQIQSNQPSASLPVAVAGEQLQEEPQVHIHHQDIVENPSFSHFERQVTNPEKLQQPVSSTDWTHALQYEEHINEVMLMQEHVYGNHRMSTQSRRSIAPAAQPEPQVLVVSNVEEQEHSQNCGKSEEVSDKERERQELELLEREMELHEELQKQYEQEDRDRRRSQENEAPAQNNTQQGEAEVVRDEAAERRKQQEEKMQSSVRQALGTERSQAKSVSSTTKISQNTGQAKSGTNTSKARQNLGNGGRTGGGNFAPSQAAALPPRREAQGSRARGTMGQVNSRKGTTTQTQPSGARTKPRNIESKNPTGTSTATGTGTGAISTSNSTVNGNPSKAKKPSKKMWR